MSIRLPDDVREDSARQRHSQKFHKPDMNEHSHSHTNYDRTQERYPEPPEKEEQHAQGQDNETNALRQQHIGNDHPQDEQDIGEEPRSPDPVIEYDQRPARCWPVLPSPV